MIEFPKMDDSYYINRFCNKKKEGYCIVGNKKNDSVLMIDATKISKYEKLFCCLDGKHSIEELSNLNFGSIDSITGILSILKSRGMLEGTQAKNSFAEAKTLSLRIFEGRVNVKSEKRVRICCKLDKLLNLITIILFFFILILNYNVNLYGYVKDGICNSGIWFYILSNLACVIFLITHEFGHLISGIRYGIRQFDISVGLYWYITPMFYVKHRNLYSLPKNNILKILFSGIKINISLVCLFLVLFYITKNNFFIMLACANLKIVLFNSLPISLTDGYFFFSLLFNVYNLRLNMYRIICNPRYIFKLEIKKGIFSFSMIICQILILVCELQWISMYVNLKFGFKIIIIVIYFTFMIAICKIKFKNTL